MRRLRGSLVPLALLAALAGCTGADEPASTPSPDAGPTATAPPTDETTPEKALSDGLRGLLGVPAVDFRYRILAGETLLTETAGRAFLAGGWSATSHFDDAATGVVAPESEDADNTILVRATDDDVFLQLSAWSEPVAGCWLQMRPGEAPLGLLAMTPELPFHIGVLGTLHAVDFAPGDDTVIIARTQLRSALLLLSGPVVQAITLTGAQARGARVPVGVLTANGVVTDVSLRGADVVQSIEDAGGTVPPETAAGLTQLDLTLRYQPAPSDAEPVTAPAPRLVMTSAELAGDGCKGEN